MSSNRQKSTTIAGLLILLGIVAGILSITYAIDDPDYLIIGDLNAYTREDPLTELGTAGFTSLLDAQNNPYSFVFDSQAGALDHAIASATRSAARPSHNGTSEPAGHSPRWPWQDRPRRLAAAGRRRRPP